MNKIVDIIFPFYANWKAEKIIKTQMFPQNEQGEDTVSTGILKGIENPNNISTETLKELYNDTFKTKDKLEDKAKINIIGITVSVSLIVGATGLLSSINTKFENSLIALCTSALLLIASVAYMILSGWLVIHMVIDENETYNVGIIEKQRLRNYEMIMTNVLHKTREKILSVTTIFLPHMLVYEMLWFVCLLFFFLL